MLPSPEPRRCTLRRVGQNFGLAGWRLVGGLTDLVFAGLLTVVSIGPRVENLVVRSLERRTVLLWGMSTGHA